MLDGKFDDSYGSKITEKKKRLKQYSFYLYFTLVLDRGCSAHILDR